MKKKAKKPKAEVVEAVFTKDSKGRLSMTLGGLEADTYSGIVLKLCEGNVKIKLEIIPNVEDANDDSFPGEDLRYWRGKVVRQVK